MQTTLQSAEWIASLSDFERALDAQSLTSVETDKLTVECLDDESKVPNMDIDAELEKLSSGSVVHRAVRDFNGIFLSQYRREQNTELRKTVKQKFVLKKTKELMVQEMEQDICLQRKEVLDTILEAEVEREMDAWRKAKQWRPVHNEMVQRIADHLNDKVQQFFCENRKFSVQRAARCK